MCSATLNEVRVDDVKPRVVGMDIFYESIVPTLKPLVLPCQGLSDDKFDEAFLKISPLKNLGFLSPKKSFCDTSHFLRSGTKLNGYYTISSGIGLGRDASGLRSDGL